MSPRRNVQRRKAPSQRFSPYDPTTRPRANADGKKRFFKLLKHSLRRNGFTWSSPVLSTNRRDTVVYKLLRAQGLDTKQDFEDALMELVDAARVLKGWSGLSSVIEIGQRIKAKVSWARSFSVVALMELLNAMIDAHELFAKTSVNAKQPDQHSALSHFFTTVEQEIGGFETFRTEYRIWANTLSFYMFVDESELFDYDGDQEMGEEAEPSFLYGINMNAPDQGINRRRRRPIENTTPSSNPSVQAVASTPLSGTINMPFRQKQAATSTSVQASTNFKDEGSMMENTTRWGTINMPIRHKQEVTSNSGLASTHDNDEGSTMETTTH